jgi:acetyl esterase/lipase
MNDIELFEADFVWPLWDAGAFAGVVADPAVGAADLVLTDVTAPCLFGYRPTTPNGHAVLIMAGGGYTQLVIGKEGVEVARWFASLGFTALVLAHRFPCATTSAQAPVDDASEAMRLIRARGDELGGIARIGAVGLSSGGHLAACLAANYPPTWTPPTSRHQRYTARPDFLVVGYGPISTNARGRTIIADKPPLPPVEKQALYDTLQPDAHLAADPPPSFIVYAGNDPVVPVRNAVRLYDALLERDATVELHIFADAPHGFALREKELPAGAWPGLCEAWLRQIGVRIT